MLGIPTSELIIFLGFDHMFSCPLFLLLSGLLAASLAACTSTRQLPMLQAAQRWRYLRKRPAYNSLPYARQVAKDLTTVATTLENNGYKVPTSSQGARVPLPVPPVRVYERRALHAMPIHVETQIVVIWEW